MLEVIGCLTRINWDFRTTCFSLKMQNGGLSIWKICLHICLRKKNEPLIISSIWTCFFLPFSRVESGELYPIFLVPQIRSLKFLSLYRTFRIPIFDCMGNWIMYHGIDENFCRSFLQNEKCLAYVLGRKKLKVILIQL